MNLFSSNISNYRIWSC